MLIYLPAQRPVIHANGRRCTQMYETRNETMHGVTGVLHAPRRCRRSVEADDAGSPARFGRWASGSRCLRGRGALGPGEYSPMLDQLAVHLRLDRAGGELDDVDCCLDG
jgi:hypothetical protein